MPAPTKVLAKLAKIIKFGQDVYQLQFLVPNRTIRFKAGQFLHLTLSDFDPSEGYWPESRVFSIASKPGDQMIEIIYSVKGNYTQKMSATLTEGMSLWLKLPYGDFVVERHIKQGQAAVFVAGGTGISPFIPYFLEVIGKDVCPPLRVYYGIRDADHYLYKEIVETVRTKADVQIVEGPFDIKMICEEIAGMTEAVCFISGPPVMIGAFQNGLEHAGFPRESVIIDAWE
ncbi:MAG: hypothetical protein CVV48_04615 [Spirochaetae bacterium HGW-Spirochaetae-4]|nr:MAG: hypothetical protein CVV48_04615 [Spirochaetae bacterium HGW-Spirochaetae-4]